MFGQMKSRRTYTKPTPCPCNNVCRCHQPPRDINVWEVISIIVGIIVLFGFPIGLAWCMSNHPPSLPQVEYIMVNGQNCQIKHISHCTSTGACSGHNEAVCEK